MLYMETSDEWLTRQRYSNALFIVHPYYSLRRLDALVEPQKAYVKCHWYHEPIGQK